MPLTEQQQETARNWLQANDRPCHHCGSTRFQFGEIIRGDVFSPEGLMIGGRSIPMLQVICDSCAHVHLFAAVKMGLTK